MFTHLNLTVSRYDNPFFAVHAVALVGVVTASKLLFLYPGYRSAHAHLILKQ